MYLRAPAVFLVPRSGSWLTGFGSASLGGGWWRDGLTILLCPRSRRFLQAARDQSETARTMGQHWGVRIPSSTLVLSIFCLEGAGAFLAPTSLSARDAKLQQQRQCCKKSPLKERLGSAFGRSAVVPRMAADGDKGDSPVVASSAEEAEAKAAKLRAFAAELRNQVCRNPDVER